MNGSLASLLSESTAIVVVLPQNPSLDSVAAGLALYLALKSQKQVDIVCSEPMRVEFNRLVGVNKVKTEVGNRNLIIKFRDYKATDIERVSYDIENSEFKLTVVPKDGILPPSTDQVVSSHSGISANTALLIGGAGLQDFASISDLKGAKLIHFGISAMSGQGATEVVSLAGSASSISELVYYRLNEAGITVDSDVASNLLSGIEEESNGFASDQTTADTFLAIAELLRAGGIRNQVRLQNQADLQMAPAPAGNPMEPPLQAEKPQGQAPNEWFGPKIYKGTAVS